MSRLLLLFRNSNKKTYRQVMQALNPLVYFPYHETSGTVALEVMHGWNGAYNRNVALMGTIAGPKGNSAPNFDGTNDAVNCLTSNFAANFNGAAGTIAFWAKASSSAIWTDATQRRFVNLNADVQNLVQMTRTNTNNQILASYRAGNTLESQAVATSTLNWFHFGMAWDKPNEVCNFYYNGLAQPISVNLGIWTGTVSTFNVGAQLLTPTQPWSGGISDLAIWTYPLTAVKFALIGT